jgi:hypothetical protein
VLPAGDEGDESAAAELPPSTVNHCFLVYIIHCSKMHAAAITLVE